MTINETLYLANSTKAYVTSDLHFGHKAIFRFCPDTRKKYGSTVEEMNAAMMKEWNQTVTDDDFIIILGDVSFASVTATAEILSELKGNKILVSGNHDYKYLDKKLFTVWFQQIHDILEVDYLGSKYVMCHFPIAEWNRCHWGAIHLHGHLHGTESPVIKELHKYKCFDVGMDATGKLLTPLEEFGIMAKERSNYKHGSGEQGI